MKLAIRIFVMILILPLFAAVPAIAQVEWGVRAGTYLENSDAFFGVEAIWPMGRQLYFNPNLEYVVAEGDDFLTLNADAHYDFLVDRNFTWWAGAGLAALIGEDDVDFGANLLTGFGFPMRNLIPYVQGKLLISEGENDVAIGVGVRF